MEYRFGIEKNEYLMEERGFSFEDIIAAIQQGGLVAEDHHPNREKYPYQKIMYVQMKDAVYVVPFVQNPDHYFLKTAFKSRVATKKYLTP